MPLVAATFAFNLGLNHVKVAARASAVESSFSPEPAVLDMRDLFPSVGPCGCAAFDIL